MMEKFLLGLLCLSGWNISSCLPFQYHYVAEPMTWAEAQTHCRQKYTDLATVENTEEVEQLKSTVPSLLADHSVWIGLYSKIQWKWSDGYTGSGADYRNWDPKKEPDFWGLQFCVMFIEDGTWVDVECVLSNPFICYKGTQQDPHFVYVSEEKTWSNAQKYCRENYIDLATVTNYTETQVRSLVPTESWGWIGLYRDPDMNWSNGSLSTYTNWRISSSPLGSMSVACGAAELPKSGQWILSDCKTKYPFVCYGSPVTKQVMKIRMKPEDSTVDLNDPAVKAQILKKFQDRLKENGLSGVTLKWREQPDGKVFRLFNVKEEKTEL